MKVAVVGVGGVGASVAFNLLLRPEPFAVELIGPASIAVSHEMDLQQVLATGATGSVEVVPAAAVADADVVVIAASAPLTVNRSRLVYLADNARILGALARSLPPSWPGVVLVVTNPVDVLVTWLVATCGLPSRRVVGYTANDSLRLRTAVGEALAVDPARVDAWVLGEHGDACVPLLDRVAVDGEPVTLDAAARAAADAFVRTWYRRHVALDSGRSSTWATGLGVARLVGALAGADDAAGLWPASVVLDGEYGVGGAAITVPVEIGAGGIGPVREWTLPAEARVALLAAADGVAAAAASIEPAT